MSSRYKGGFISLSYDPFLVPNAPTIGTATAGNQSASVTFTAPSNVGGGAITSYVVLSSGGQTATGSSSPITVTGLTNGTAYTFVVFAINAYGNSPASAASNSATPIAPQQVEYTTPGTYSWVAPSGITSNTVAVVCVAGGGGATRLGGGGGGELRYKNGISVTAGNSYTVVVGASGSGSTYPDNLNATSGGNSTFNSTTCIANGGKASYWNSSDFAGPGGSGGTGDGGGNGGSGASNKSAGGGGAGGYAGAGGAGGGVWASGNAGAGGGGGGGGGGNNNNASYGGAGGGGVGLLGQGSNGIAGASGYLTYPSGGGGGSSGSTGNGPSGSYGGGNGGLYGGGGGGPNNDGSNFYAGGSGASGAVRIIWSTAGVSRSFPSTNTGNL